MKNSINKVYSKLSKQKVELSSIPKLQEASDLLTIDNTNIQELEDMTKTRDVFDKYLEETIQAARYFIEEYEYISEQYYDMPNTMQIRNVLDDFASNAEALGLDPTTVDIYNILEEQYKEIDNFHFKVQNFVENFNGEYILAQKLTEQY
jgi:hypothetical protein